MQEPRERKRDGVRSLSIFLFLFFFFFFFSLRFSPGLLLENSIFADFSISQLLFLVKGKGIYAERQGPKNH
jgi:hypothetical protein